MRCRPTARASPRCTRRCALRGAPTARRARRTPPSSSRRRGRARRGRRDSRSSVASSFASTSGLRCGTMRMHVPSRSVGAAAAANASQISGSGIGVSGCAGILPSAVYGYGDSIVVGRTTCSPPHSDSKPAASARRHSVERVGALDGDAAGERQSELHRCHRRRHPAAVEPERDARQLDRGDRRVVHRRRVHHDEAARVGARRRRRRSSGSRRPRRSPPSAGTNTGSPGMRRDRGRSRCAAPVSRSYFRIAPDWLIGSS